MPHPVNAFVFVYVCMHAYKCMWRSEVVSSYFQFFNEAGSLTETGVHLLGLARLAGHQVPRFLLCPSSPQAGITGTHCHSGL